MYTERCRCTNKINVHKKIQEYIFKIKYECAQNTYTNRIICVQSIKEECIQKNTCTKIKHTCAHIIQHDVYRKKKYTHNMNMYRKMLVYTQ